MKIIYSSLLLLFWINFSSCDRTPEKLFETAIDKDALKSAKVMEGSDPSFLDCCIFLHFTVNSTELATYLKDAQTKDLMSMNTNLYPGTEWWNPAKFGEDVKCFERVIPDKPETSIKEDAIETFYVNNNMTEVYYRKYLP